MTNTRNRRARSSPSAADPLTINVAGLLAEPAGSTRRYHIAGPTIDLGPDLHQAEGLEGDVHLTRTNRGLLIQAHLDTALEQECSRCLRDIEYPVEVDIDEEALPSVDLTSGLPLDATEEPDVLRLNAHHELRLEQTVREAIQLAEPIAPLCREDCPGLCPVCGQELASGPHDHPDEPIDPRLEALRELLPAEDGSGES